MANELWLARHGNRQDFIDRNWYQTASRPFDPPLSEDGEEQARRLGRRLQGEGIRRIFTSPFLRAVQTAHHVAEAIEIPVYLEPGLGEWHNPAWFPEQPWPYGYEDLVGRFPRLVEGHSPIVAPVFPESEAEAMTRVAQTASTLAERYEGPLLLVGHAITVAGTVLGLARDEREVECALCSLSHLIRQGDGWRAALSGDVCHLEEVLGRVVISNVAT